MEKKTLVMGVIGADVHAVGNKILYHAFTAAGFNCVNLGVMVSQEEYINVAIESNADVIVVSSLYGHGELAILSLVNSLLTKWKSVLKPWALIVYLDRGHLRKPPSPPCMRTWAYSPLKRPKNKERLS